MTPRSARMLAAFALFACARAGAAVEALPELIDRFDHLRVGDAVSVGELRLKAGRLECVLRSGRAAPVFAGNEVVGVFSAGPGSLEYLSEDPVEAPVLSFVARKASSLSPEKTEKGIRLRDSFDRILWLAAWQPIPPISGSPAPSLAEDFARQREKFRRSHAPPLSHDFAIQKLDAPSAPLVWAEMDGGREDLVYRLDGVDNPSEEIGVLHRSESQDPEMRKFLWLIPLSHQPIGRDRRDPPSPRFLLTDVDLELVASAGNDAKLSVVETLVPVGQPITALRFELDKVVYAQSGSNLGTRTERVQKIGDENGRPIAFDHQLDELVVQLAEPAPPEKPVRLRFEIDGDFLVRPGGDNYWELGTRAWFPQPSLSGQGFAFHAVVRVKKPFVPFAPGQTIRRESQGDENVLETRIEEPIEFPVILSGRYETHEETRNGVKVLVATYALRNPRAMARLTDIAADVIAFYESFLGPFPFREFNIIEINDVGFGQAPPATLFITREAFDPLLGDMSQLAAQGVAKTFAHEIAHQYWGIVVRIPTREEQWLSESFAEYCAALFLKARRGTAVYNALFNRWKKGARFATDAAPIPMANRVWISNDQATRSAIRIGLLYDKGPLLLAALQKEVGDETFLAFLKSCQTSFRWKFGTTRSAAGLLQTLSKKDYMPFFEKYYWGTAMPAAD